MRRITSLLLCGGVLLAIATLLAQTPNHSDEVMADISSLEKMVLETPSDPVILYNLAADYAEEHDHAKTLSLLRRVAELPGGLDAGEYRAFSFLRSDPEFQALVGAIRRKNPPTIHSMPAFTIKERDLFPEGTAYDPVSHRLYAGSVKRKIVWTDAAGNTKDLISPAQDGIAFVLGLHIDSKRRRLWVVSSALPGIAASPKPVTGLFEYDLERQALAKLLPLPSNAGGFLNDVTVSTDGMAYTTNTTTGAVLSGSEKSSMLEEFLPSGSVRGANGIALSDDDKSLFVAGDFGLRVDTKTKSIQMLRKADPTIVDASMDGLYWFRGSLVGIQNGIHPGRVMRFYLDQTRTRIERSEVLEAYNPLYENPTTGSLDQDSLLFAANPQLHKFEFGKPLPPVDQLHELTVLRLPLK